MTVKIAGKIVGVDQIVAAVGGLVAIIAAFLGWVSSEGVTVGGMDEKWGVGKSEIILGIVALLLVAALILEVKVPAIAGLKTLSLLIVVVGVLVLLVPVLAYMTTFYSDMSIKDMMDMASAAGTSVSLSIGFLLAVLAGIVVIVGGALGLMKKSA